MLKVYTETINVEINVPSAQSLRPTNAESLQSINVEINVPSAQSLRATTAESLH